MAPPGRARRFSSSPSRILPATAALCSTPRPTCGGGSARRTRLGSRLRFTPSAIARMQSCWQSTTASRARTGRAIAASVSSTRSIFARTTFRVSAGCAWLRRCSPTMRSMTDAGWSSASARSGSKRRTRFALSSIPTRPSRSAPIGPSRRSTRCSASTRRGSASARRQEPQWLGSRAENHARGDAAGLYLRERLGDVQRAKMGTLAAAGGLPISSSSIANPSRSRRNRSGTIKAALYDRGRKVVYRRVMTFGAARSPVLDRRPPQLTGRGSR